MVPELIRAGAQSHPRPCLAACPPALGAQPPLPGTGRAGAALVGPLLWGSDILSTPPTPPPNPSSLLRAEGRPRKGLPVLKEFSGHPRGTPHVPPFHPPDPPPPAPNAAPEGLAPSPQPSQSQPRPTTATGKVAPRAPVSPNICLGCCRHCRPRMGMLSQEKPSFFDSLLLVSLRAHTTCHHQKQ